MHGLVLETSISNWQNQPDLLCVCVCVFCVFEILSNSRDTRNVCNGERTLASVCFCKQQLRGERFPCVFPNLACILGHASSKTNVTHTPQSNHNTERAKRPENRSGHTHRAFYLEATLTAQRTPSLPCFCWCVCCWLCVVGSSCVCVAPRRRTQIHSFIHIVTSFCPGLNSSSKRFEFRIVAFCSTKASRLNV